MESTRQQKVARLIQKELAEFMRTSSPSFGSGVLVSVTVVRVTPDLGLAKVYLSVFPSNRGTEIVKKVQERAQTFRYDLGKIVRNQLRVIPELKFYLDDSLDYADRIDELLSE